MQNQNKTRKHFIEELEKSKPSRTKKEFRKFFQAVEQSPVSIVITDIEGNIEYVNPKFSWLTGYSYEEAIGKNPRILKTGKMQPEHYKIMWETIASGKEWRGEFHNKKKNGEFFWESASISPVKNRKGEVTHYIAVKEDITEQKKINEELKKSKEDAESATRLKDQFVSLVAHDLRSPFNVLLGFLTLMKSDAENPLHQKHEQMVERMLESGRGLVKMIDQLLNISRLQTGKMRPARKFIDGYGAALHVIGRLEFLAREKGVELINEVPRGSRLYADWDFFVEVLQNLVSNAIKFCRRGDRINIFVPPGKQAVIAVKDTGNGVSVPILPNLFRHEIKTTTLGTAGEKGTGLGLPFSCDIMKAHGGSLTVESVEGKGATFQAELPFARPVILLVTDGEDDREIAKSLLSEMDLEFIDAENGKEALHILESTTPHLIISDIRMPEINGFELLEHLKTRLETKDIPFIIFSASTEIETRDTAFRKGAVDFIARPLAPEDFISRVRRFVI